MAPDSASCAARLGDAAVEGDAGPACVRAGLGFVPRSLEARAAPNCLMSRTFWGQLSPHQQV